MEAQDLKERVLEDEKIEEILESLGMHSIHANGKYIQCGMPDGDNKSSTIVYLDNLRVEAYTRNIVDRYGVSDIISLVSFVNETYFLQSIKWICDICGYDYYGKVEESSSLKKWINKMWRQVQDSSGEDEKVEPIDEKIINYYKPYVNKLFYYDGIDYESQREFEVGYDLDSHRITLPIRDEIGTLVGVKGRIYNEKVDVDEDKYIYLEPCPKTKILYGLHKTLNYIKKEKEVIVVESEKGVMQLWSMGVRNAVAIGGHMLSNTHVDKLTHLNVDIVIAFDEGVEIGKDEEIDKKFYRNEFDKFLPHQVIYCIYDKDGEVLSKKESPADDKDKWNKLYSEYKFKVRG